MGNFISYLLAPHRLPYFILLFLGIAIGGIRFKYLNRSSRVFFILLCTTLLNEIIGYLYKYELKVGNNAGVYNTFTFIQFGLVCMGFYFQVMIRKYIIFTLIVFYAFAIFNAIFWQSFLIASNSNTLLLESLFIIIWVMLFFTAFFRKIDNTPIYQFPLFWIGMGWLIFSIVSILSFGFYTLNELTPYWKNISFWARALANYLLYLSFIPAFLSPQKSLNDPAPGK